MDPQLRARAAVSNYWTEREDEITVISDVVTVWFCYILGGWKTLLFMPRYPGRYFEVTYDLAKERMYLDTYTKTDNVVIEDDSDFKIASLRERLSRE